MKKLFKSILLLIATITMFSVTNGTAYAYTIPEHKQNYYNMRAEQEEQTEKYIDVVIWVAVPKEDIETFRDCGLYNIYASLESVKNDYGALLSCDILRDCALQTDSWWLYKFEAISQTGEVVPSGDDYTFSAYISSSDPRLFSEDSAIIARCFTDSDRRSFYPELDANPVMTVSMDHFVTDEFITKWQDKYQEEIKTGSPFLWDSSFVYFTPLSYLYDLCGEVKASNNAFVMLGSIKNLANVVGHEEDVFVSLFKEFFKNELARLYEVAPEELSNISLANAGLYHTLDTTLGLTGHLKDYMTFIQPLGISLENYAESEFAPALIPLRNFNDYKARGDENWEYCGSQPTAVEMHIDYLKQFGYDIKLPDMSEYTADDVLNYRVPLYIGEGTALVYPDYSAGITEAPEITPIPTATPIVVARATNTPVPTKNTIDTISPAPTQAPVETEPDFPIKNIIIIAVVSVILVGAVIIAVKRKK